MKPKAIIVDLDGTLCDTSHRQHFMQKKPKDWKSFYEGIPHDKPHEWCKEIVDKMRQHFTIIFVSGRPKDHLNETTLWLSRNEIAADFICMRPSGDFRKDSIVKEEIYRKEIEPYFDILFCIDDRKQVVDMWRQIGLTCLQCAEGNF